MATICHSIILDEAIVQDWLAGQDYNLGDVIRNKGKYYSARKFIPVSPTLILMIGCSGDKPSRIVTQFRL